MSLCLAAMIDYASETKLRVLSFVEIMKPIVFKSKVVALQRWIAAHAYALKIDMAD